MAKLALQILFDLIVGNRGVVLSNKRAFVKKTQYGGFPDLYLALG